MWKYTYDDAYFIMEQANAFLKFDNYEDEEAFARSLRYGRR